MEVFISHSHRDAALAQVFEEGFLQEVSFHSFKVQRSSKDGSIEYGESWIDWIDKRVQTAKITFILLTPSSFSSQWVLWEAGAVSGVQRAAQALQDDRHKKVIPVKFGIDSLEDLGPFQHIQVLDGLSDSQMKALAQTLLKKLESNETIQSEQVFDMATQLKDICAAYVEGAKAVLERLQISQSGDLVNEWIARLDQALNDKNFAFVRSARRWINIAFLGPGRAEDRETPIDFQIHARLAAGFSKLREWQEAKAQLELAKALSPRDMMVLRKLGRAELELKNPHAAREVCDQMREFDAVLFSEDEEALMLSVRVHIEDGNESGALADLKGATRLANNSTYVLNMLAILTAKVEGYAQAERHFRALRKLETETDGQSHWSVGNLTNAALGLGDKEQADSLLDRLKSMEKANENRESISRYFDAIIDAREGFTYNWKERWPDH